MIGVTDSLETGGLQNANHVTAPIMSVVSPNKVFTFGKVDHFVSVVYVVINYK